MLPRYRAPSRSPPNLSQPSRPRIHLLPLLRLKAGLVRARMRVQRNTRKGGGEESQFRGLAFHGAVGDLGTSCILGELECRSPHCQAATFPAVWERTYLMPVGVGMKGARFTHKADRKNCIQEGLPGLGCGQNPHPSR